MTIYNDEKIIDNFNANEYNKAYKENVSALDNFYKFQEKILIQNVNNITVKNIQSINKQVLELETLTRYLDKDSKLILENHIIKLKEQYENLNLIYSIEVVKSNSENYDSNLSLLKSCLVNQTSITKYYIELSRFEVNQKILSVINKYLDESVSCFEFLITLLH